MMLERAAPLLTPTRAIAMITLAAAALLAGAWWFELVVGLLPCKLCLQQRWPHYLALGTGMVLLVGITLGWRVARPGLWLLAAVFAVSTAMGMYHAGVEWGWFTGPNDCGGATPPAAASTADFLRQLQTTRVVSCTEAAWRFLGLSLAGWNAVTSAGLALFALAALKVQGSSSLSQ